MIETFIGTTKHMVKKLCQERPVTYTYCTFVGSCEKTGKNFKIQTLAASAFVLRLVESGCFFPVPCMVGGEAFLLSKRGSHAIDRILLELQLQAAAWSHSEA